MRPPGVWTCLSNLVAVGVAGAALLGCGDPPDPEPDVPGTSPTLPVPTVAPTSNVLLILLDDVGADAFSAWGVRGPDPASYPRTPQIDALAASGVRFDNAYAMPLCSASRATLLTGRYPWRHGVGFALELTDTGALPLDEVLIPEVLEGAPEPWAHAWLGKWHLGGLGGPRWDSPLQHGFQDFAGSIGNLSEAYSSGGDDQTYFGWEKDTNGTLAWTTTYATEDTVNDALDRIETLPRPWFVGVSLNTAHAPYAFPPAGTTSGVLVGDDLTDQKFNAMVENADHEIGRLIGGMSAELRSSTLVVLVADNGTPVESTSGPLDPAHMKGTVFEGGVRVPMIVIGPEVRAPGTTCTALVSIADLFATVAEVAQAPLDPAVPVDSTSLLPYLADPSLPSLRAAVQAETFNPGGFVDRRMHRRMIRDERYKLVQELGDADRLYDLAEDRLELVDLLSGPLDAQEQAAYDELVALLPAPL